LGAGIPGIRGSGSEIVRREGRWARELLGVAGMGRVPRILLVEDGSTNHCTWRSHGHSFVLDSDEAKEVFLALVRDHKEKHGIEIHSYCLMGTHPHVMCRARGGQRAFSGFWKAVNWRFARWYNRRTNGRGQVVMERLRSPRIQEGPHQLEVMRYGDLNPVRAKLVKSPKEWRWSSYRHYAFGERDELITDAPAYLALGRSGRARRSAYVHLFAQPLVGELLSRRHDLVYAPFFGDRSWTRLQLFSSGLSPPLL
jgi:putative transposase